MVQVFLRPLAFTMMILSEIGLLTTQLSFSATESESLMEVEQEKHLSETLDILDQLRLMTQQRTKRKELLCMKAFGHKVFCACLAHESPVGVTFEQYLTIVITARDEMNYSGLKDEDKTLVDNSRRARDVCAEQAFKP